MDEIAIVYVAITSIFSVFMWLVIVGGTKFDERE